jgi:outer membrane protein assembly factor BamB
MPTGRRSLRVWLIAIGVVLTLASGTAAYLVTRDDAGNVDGSTEGFVATQTAPQTPPPPDAWPEYGFNAARTRANEALDLAPPFTEQWRYDAGSLLEFPPVVGDGRAYVGTNRGLAVAIDTSDGRQVWSTKLAGQIASSPALTRDRVLFTTTRGRLVSLGREDGVRRWSVRIGSSSESSPLVIGDSAYVGTLDGDVLRVRVATGETVWRARAAGEVKASLAEAGPNVVVGDYAGRVTAFAKRTGARVWQVASPGPRLRGSGRFYGGPAVAYGRVVVGNVNNRVVVQAATGARAWVRTLGDFVYSSPAVSEQRVFVGSYDQKLYALDAVTGRVRWSFDAGERISGSPSVIGRLVYVSTLAKGGRDGTTFALDVTTGTRVWSFPDGRYSPAVATEGLLVLTGRQTLYGLTPS